jgi:hypothetical protein
MALIITVYKQPKLIELLLRAMQHEGFHFYLHIDKKVDIKDYEYLFQFPNTFLVKTRVDIKWAGYSMVEALLAGMNQALESGIQYDFINHISGQCYPIKPINQIYNFFDQHKGKNFLSCEPAPNAWWNDARTKYQHYHLHDFGFKGNHRLADFLTMVLPKRKLPFAYTLYGSPLGAYWMLSNKAAAYIVDYLDKNKRVSNYFKKTWGCDEYLFNTIIMNSAFKQDVINNNYHYIDWSKGGASPKVLTVDDFELFKKTDAFFARKFDLNIDAQILERINNFLLS